MYKHSLQLAMVGVSPIGFGANSIAAFESLIGLLSFALATGLLFAKFFSRPVAKIIYSKKAVIAPYRGITDLCFEWLINLTIN